LQQNNKILPQLIYHGKKTVPAALRRDSWTPYFSLHFPPNEYGSSSGLLAYHQLRELSKQRQLAPPEDMVVATQEDIDRRKARYNPIELDQMLNDKKLTLPQVGQLLPKKLRAKKLMSQKATAVADVAFVLGLQADGPDAEEAARLKEERRKEWWNNVSRGAKARARKRARLREAKEAQLEARRTRVMKANGSVGLNADAAARIAMEYRGALVGVGDQVDLTKPEASVQEEAGVTEVPDSDAVDKATSSRRGRLSHSGEVPPETHEKERGDPLSSPPSVTTETGTDVQPSAARPAAEQEARDAKEVRILWADLRDAAYAHEWPETVIHAELERMAIAKSKVLIPQSRTEVLVTHSRSIHVIGGQKGSGWYLDPDEVQALKKGPSKEVPVGAVGEAQGAEGAKDATSGDGSQGDQDFVRRQHAAESLREEGIEVEAPRRGLWAMVKGLVGR
jgi:hypothetical protein